MPWCLVKVFTWTMSVIMVARTDCTYCAGHVDTDDGFIAVVPLDLVLDCGSDYTKWLIVCNENQFTALFQLENTYKPSFENGVFVLDDIVLDTTDLSFVPEEDRTIIEERVRNLEPDQCIGREMTAYLVMNAMSWGTSSPINPLENASRFLVI